MHPVTGSRKVDAFSILWPPTPTARRAENFVGAAGGAAASRDLQDIAARN